jgi:Sel1 repeat/TonB C terminal
VVKAAYRLGWMYARGNGVPQDYVEAHTWLNIATARAFADEQRSYAQVRDGVAREMTGAQIAGAERRAREWLAVFESNDICKNATNRFRASLTFDAQGIEFESWIRQFVDQLNRNWMNPPCSSLESRSIYTLVVTKDGRTSRLDLRARSALPDFDDAVFRAFARWRPIPLPDLYPGESVPLVVTFFFNEPPP